MGQGGDIDVGVGLFEAGDLDDAQGDDEPEPPPMDDEPVPEPEPVPLSEEVRAYRDAYASWRADAEDAYARIAESCASCHAAYRN